VSLERQDPLARSSITRLVSSALSHNFGVPL